MIEAKDYSGYTTLMTTNEVREKYLSFFQKRGHKIIPPAPLVLENDSTTLFTSSGMQPLVKYLMGEKHPEGKRLVDSQPSIRVQDIEEVGNNRHTTFFEMLGNWSLGDYFKKEQLPWIWEFFTEDLGLPKEKLYVSIFEGNDSVPRDGESYEIWKSLGIPKDHIFEYGVDKNWWSRSGTPDQMPVGEIGGPDSEVFFEFTQVEHDKKFGEKCHPNCDCGRFLEIGNSVFMQYKKLENGKLEELPQKNVDFGGGLERIVAAINNDPDVLKIDVYKSYIEKVENISDKSYADFATPMRIIADHLRAANALVSDGVVPSNKLQGYILRRLIRRAVVKMKSLKEDVTLQDFAKISDNEIIVQEVEKFEKTLDKGLKILGNTTPFDLFQTYGFPPELTQELYKQKGLNFDKEEFENQMKQHQEKSRAESAESFKIK